VESLGSAVGQAVRHWNLTAAARVPARVRIMGFVVDKEELRHVFYQYFDFPYQAFNQLVHTLSSIIRGWYDRSVVASELIDLFAFRLN
jgi:hypothetical protein